MTAPTTDYGLEFLLAFHGRIHHLESGYWIKFEIKRVRPSRRRPHGLSFSFTLHDPEGKRLIGFDNAYAAGRSGFGQPQTPATDHWHRTATDLGRPYEFKDAATLIDDFFDAVDGLLREHGAGATVVAVSERGKSR